MGYREMLIWVAMKTERATPTTCFLFHLSDFGLTERKKHSLSTLKMKRSKNVRPSLTDFWLHLKPFYNSYSICHTLCCFLLWWADSLMATSEGIARWGGSWRP